MRQYTAGLLVVLIAALTLRVGLCGEINGQIVISRRLTRARVSAPIYNLRGISVPMRRNDTTLKSEFARVAVYLEGSGLPKRQPITAELTQEGLRFRPEVLIVPAGSVVSFPNEDPVFHNVFSLSHTKSFDLGNYPMHQTRTVRMDKPGIVQVYCHLHVDMSAAIVVVASASYTSPDAAGEFHLSEIPAGQYDLVVWHKSAGFARQRVHVTTGGTTKLTLHLPLGSEGEQ